MGISVKMGHRTLQSCKGHICRASTCYLPAGAGAVNFHGVACPLAAGDVSLGFGVQLLLVSYSLAHLDIEITSEGSAGKLLCATISTSPGALELDVEDVCKNDSECPDGKICTRDSLSLSAACHTPCDSDLDCTPGIRCARARGGPCWCVGS